MSNDDDNQYNKKLEVNSSKGINKLAQTVFNHFRNSSGVNSEEFKGKVIFPISTYWAGELAAKYAKYVEKLDEEPPNALAIEIEIPDDTPPEKVKELIKQAALRADMTHRSLGGKGLTVNTVEVTKEAKSLEPSGK